MKSIAQRINRLSLQYAQRYGFERTDEWVMIKLQEEVGELCQAFLKHQKQTRHANETQTVARDLADEVADVLGMTLIIAELFDVDIDAALERKWFRHEAENLIVIQGNPNGST